MQAALGTLSSATAVPVAIVEVVQRQSGGSHPWVPAALAGGYAPTFERSAGIWGQVASLFLSLVQLTFLWIL